MDGGPFRSIKEGGKQEAAVLALLGGHSGGGGRFQMLIIIDVFGTFFYYDRSSCHGATLCLCWSQLRVESVRVK